jgi:hypothetical protein
MTGGSRSYQRFKHFLRESTMKQRELHFLTAFLWCLPLLVLSRTADAQITLNDAKEIAAFPLTTEKMHAKYRISVALAGTFAAGKPNSMRDAEQSLDEQIRTLQNTPNVESVCRSNGLSVRDYALTTLAINLAMSPMYNPKYRQYVPRKADDPMDVAATPEHVQFVQAHLTEIHSGIQQVAAAYEAAKSKSQ